MNNIYALVLAAGIGSRLRPLTNKIPKCMLEIGGKPILGRWLDNLIDNSCSNILVNTHHLSKSVEQYISDYNSNYECEVLISREKTLLGTGGTLMKNKNFFKSDLCIVMHADNATDFNIKNIIESHSKKPKHCILTMLTFTTSRPSQCGIVEIDKHGVVQAFHEKKKNPPGNIANGALYVFDRRLFDELEPLENILHDISTDIIPKLIGRIFTCHTDMLYIDIGTPETLAVAQKNWFNSSSKS